MKHTSIRKKETLKLFLSAALCFGSGTMAAETADPAPSVKQTISISQSNVSLDSFFRALEQQSGYLFFYNKSILRNNETVTVNAQDESVTEILNRVLPSRNMTYSLKDRQIVISRLSDNSQPRNTNTQQSGYEAKGVVVDVNGMPLMGATVMIKGASTGTITDLDGNYTLKIKGNEPVQLVISYVGYLPKTIKVDSVDKTKRVVLQENSQVMDEVVVVGYGTQKKLNMTGAVGTASGKVLEDRPIGNVAQGLQGIIPNLNITFNSGQPNQAAKINIRGTTSINGGSALVLVDGVEISDISLINPQDIESVSVLKDAASASIYGARAAFGVMLVTTKKGQLNQKVRINYNNNLSWSTPARLPESPRADIWCRAINRMYDYASPGSYYFNDRFLEALDAHIADPKNNPAILVDTEGIQNSNYTPNNPGWAYVGNTDWLNEFYKNSAFMQQHNMSLSGGTDRNSYYASLGFKDQDGIFRYGNDNYKRLNMSFNFNTKATDWLDLGFVAKYNDIRNDEPFKDNAGSDMVTWYYEVYRMYPTLSIFLPNGDFAGLSLRSGNYNVIGAMALAGRNKKRTDDIWFSGNFNLRPFKDIAIKGDYSINRYLTRQKIHRKTQYQTMPEGVDAILSETPSYVRNYNSSNTYQAFNVWAEYNKTIDKAHNFAFKLGYNHESKRYENTSYTMTDLFDNELPVSDLAINYLENAEQLTEWRVQGGFFRVNYDYQSKYLLEVNGRYDGSTRFPKNKRHTFLPSASVGWRISEEKFFRPVTEVVNNLKLRGSIGVLGNQAIDNTFSYLNTLSGNSTLNYMMNGALITGLNAPTIPDLITWEKVISANLGLDWGLFNNRLNGSVDIYQRDTKDMVSSYALPAVVGTGSGKDNIADLRTRGWELEISWKDRIGNLLNSPVEYSVSGSVADYQAEITKFDNPTGALANPYKGKKLGEIWGYVTDGYIQDDNEAAAMNYVQRFISSKWYPGEIRYKDLNGDGIINTGKLTLDDPGDRKVIGNNTPRYRYNMQGSLSWKGFDLRVIFEGVGKRDMWISSDQFWGFSRGIYNSNITQYHIDNTWTYENQKAYFPRPADNTKSKQVQSKYLQNAAYLRLKDVTLSYSFPKQWMSKIFVNQLRIYVSGYNLWEKTHLLPFMTPDIMDQISESMSSENAGKQYAFMRSYSCGVNITF
ncbi:MAG: TonB-dependent receptor [Bacteroidales bacterium]